MVVQHKQYKKTNTTTTATISNNNRIITIINLSNNRVTNQDGTYPTAKFVKRCGHSICTSRGRGDENRLVIGRIWRQQIAGFYVCEK